MLAPFSQEVLLYVFAITATVLEYILIAISVGYIDKIYCLQSICKKCYTRRLYSYGGVFLDSPVLHILNLYKVVACHKKKKQKNKTKTQQQKHPPPKK